jgi:tetratricopeptide (TPR) repeat protein
LEAKGSADEATRHYEEMLRVFDHLQKQSAEKGRSWRQDQAIAHERLGTIALNRGHTGEARQHYEKGHRLLVSSGSGGEKHQRQLATLEEKLGAVSEAAGDLEQAARHYSNQLTMLRQLNSANPDDTRLQAAHAIAQGRKAAVLVRMGKDLPEAAGHAERQTRLFLHLTELEPLHREWRSQLLKAHFLEGVVQDATGKSADAIASFQKALRLCGQAIFEQAEDDGFKKQSVAIHLRLAVVCLKSNQTVSAKEHARVAISGMAALKATPEISEWRKTAEAILD